MATKTKPGTAVAKAKVNLPAEVMAATAQEIAEYQRRLAPSTGNRILATQSKMFKFPNGDESAEFEGVIVDFCAANYYYPEDFDRNNIVPATCLALGLEPTTMTPVATSPEVQSKDCASCWANQWESAAKGRGKACSNTRLLAILPPDADASTQMLVLRTSPTAIKAFDAHVAGVARTLQRPIRGVITKFTFSAESEYPTVRFTVDSPVDADLWAAVDARKDEARQMLLTPPEPTAKSDEPKKAVSKKPVSKKPVKR